MVTTGQTTQKTRKGAKGPPNHQNKQRKAEKAGRSPKCPNNHHKRPENHRNGRENHQKSSNGQMMTQTAAKSSKWPENHQKEPENNRKGGTSARRLIFWWLRKRLKISLLDLTWNNSFKEWLLAVASLQRYLCSKAGEKWRQGTPIRLELSFHSAGVAELSLERQVSSAK